MPVLDMPIVIVKVLILAEDVKGSCEFCHSIRVYMCSTAATTL